MFVHLCVCLLVCIFVCLYIRLCVCLCEQKSGAATVSDSERDKVMVHDLLELKTKMDDIIAKAFQESMKFYDTLREAFESVVNRRQNKPAELIGEGERRGGGREGREKGTEREGGKGEGDGEREGGVGKIW